MKNCKILVPLDFSDAGKYALQAAHKFAKVFEGAITPFHVYIPISETYDNDFLEMDTFYTPMTDYEDLEQIHREHLHEMAAHHVPEDVLRKPLVSIGNPAAAIKEAAADFDLIVMSSHGRSGFSRLFLGSVSDKVLRTSHVPVLTVNEEKQLKSFERIMLATDFSDHSAKVFPLARKIALKAGAAVELVHIISFEDYEDEPDEEIISRRKKRLEILAKQKLADITHLLETKIIVSSLTTHEAILNEDLNNPHDLIVMSTVGHTGIEYLMMGSTTSNVVRHVKSPVLSLNPKQTKSSNEEE